MNADDFVGGHSILALERFMDDARHMIIFDVLSWKWQKVNEVQQFRRTLQQEFSHQDTFWDGC